MEVKKSDELIIEMQDIPRKQDILNGKRVSQQDWTNLHKKLYDAIRGVNIGLEAMLEKDRGPGIVAVLEAEQLRLGVNTGDREKVKNLAVKVQNLVRALPKGQVVGALVRPITPLAVAVKDLGVSLSDILHRRAIDRVFSKSEGML